MRCSTMAEDYDDDEFFENKIKTFDDILDSPILTTVRRDINRYTQYSFRYSRSNLAAYSSQGMTFTANFKHELKRRLITTFKRKVSSVLLENCLDLGLDLFNSGVKNVQLSDIRYRFDVLHDLMNIGKSKKVTDLSEIISDSLNLYDRVREGTIVQIDSDVSPLAKVHGIIGSAITEANKYAGADEYLEKIIHMRQDSGLKNKQGCSRLLFDGKNFKAIVHYGDAVAFIDNHDIAHLSSWDDLLCIRSMATFRRNSYILCSIDPNLPVSLWSNLKKMLEWQESCVYKYGNEGYELLKATESVFKSRLFRISDGASEGDAYDLMRLKQIEKEKNIKMKLNVTNEDLLISNLFTLAESIHDKREVAELFGALKMSGYPYVDPLIASESSKKYGTSPLKASGVEILNMKAEFCDMVTHGYIEKYGRWPPLHFTRDCKLKTLMDQKKLIFSREDYHYTDWWYTRFGKILEFDYHLDYLDLMDDRSCGLDPEDAWKAWDDLKARRPDLSKIPNDRSKKVIIRILSMETFDPILICDIFRLTDPKLMECSLALYPKEKEFKLEARLFVMLEFCMRVFLTLAGKNFKTVMKDFLPEQSTTMGRKGTMTYLESMSSISNEGPVANCFIEIDLTRWNLLWDGKVVNHVSYVVDDMFGLPRAFSRGHDLFYNSTIVVRVASELPEGVDIGKPPSSWPEGPYVWRKHRGGFEGIMQGQWAACTQAQVKQAMRDVPEVINYKLIGQGDNQVVAAQYRVNLNEAPSDQMVRISGKITKALERRFSRVNQIVKPEECLVSRTTVTYSKLIWSNGVQIPTTLKHAATVAPVGTSNIPSMMVGLGTLSSGCRASADSFSDPSIAYLYWMILARHYIIRAQKTVAASGSLSRYKFSNESLDLALLIPSDLGGFPIQVVTDFVFGGCSDRLSASIGSLVAASHTVKAAKYYLGYLDTHLPWKPNPDPAALLSDPFSAPILDSAGADTHIDRAIREVVPTYTKNKLIKEIISTETQSYKEKLSKFLASCTPLYPLIFGDLLDLSVIGVRDKIFKKFSGTRTIQQLIRSNSRINYRSEVINSDVRRFQRFFGILSGAVDKKLISKFDSRSIYLRAESYRARWFPLNENKIVGVTTIHPLECKLSTNIELSSDNYIEVIVRGSKDTVLNTKGPYKGRWGDKTWEHRKVTGVEVLGKEKAVLAAKRLLLMESQLLASGPLKECIREVLSQRTTVNPELLKILMPEAIGGIGEHRWDSMNEDKAFAWLGPITLTQHVSVQSDTMKTLSGGIDDYCFCFQEAVFFALQSIRASEWPISENFVMRCHFNIESHHKIEAQSISTNVPSPKFPRIERLQFNPLVSAGTILFQTLSSEIPLNLAPLIKLPPQCSQSIAIDLMAHYFLDQLENPRLSEAAIEQREAPAGLSLDVGCLMGVGIYPLIHAAAKAVLLRSIELSLTETYKMDNIIIAAYIDKLSSVTALPISKYANNPVIRKHPWVKSSGILINPGQFGGRVIVTRIVSLIRKIAHDLLADIYIPHSLTMIVSKFAKRATGSRVLGCYVAVLFAILTECQKIDEARKLYRKHVNEMMRLGIEEERIAMQISIIKQISEGEFETASVIANEILMGHIIRSTNLGLDQSQRYLRTGNESTKQSSEKWELNILRNKVTVVQGRSSITFANQLSSEFPTHNNKITEAKALINRNLSWTYGSSISRISLPFLYNTSLSLKNHHVLTIGVGNGALARDALFLGARKVTGLDLFNDFPSLPSLGTSYTPPEIPAIVSSKFQWAPAVFKYGGDIFDSRVQLELKSLDAEIVIIDIQPGYRLTFEDILLLTDFPHVKTIICRRYLSSAELPLFIANLRTISTKIEIAQSEFNIFEYWIATEIIQGNVLGSFNKENLNVTNIARISGLITSPDLDFYPDHRSQITIDLTKGRIPTLSNLDTVLQYLMQYLTWNPKFRKLAKNIGFSADVALLSFLLEELRKILESSEGNKETLISLLAELALSKMPLIIRGIKIPKTKVYSHYRLVTRTMAQLVVKDVSGMMTIEFV